MKRLRKDSIQEPPRKTSTELEAPSTPRTHRFLSPGLMIDYFFPLFCYFVTVPILPFHAFLGLGIHLAQYNPPALPAYIQLGLLSVLAGALLALVTPNNLAFLRWTHRLLKKERVQLQPRWATLYSFAEFLAYLFLITFVGAWLAHNISPTLFYAFGMGGFAFIMTCTLERFMLLRTLLGITRNRGKQIIFRQVRTGQQKRRTRLELRLTQRTQQ